ncbi:hypothetical protein [Chromobacterium vaccinii]|uniref:hypothetical protein n=1 Tax=Chromobacterium vaccinii TaxID=1108595 RepID=UPI000E135D47|nr:hypothetical protein [Chromobacterium vaccinii]SUX30701.1 Uncharacterised protein [Chromobacterium vaccinii]
MNKRYCFFIKIALIIIAIIAVFSYVIASIFGPSDASTTIWSNFWSVFNNITLLITLLVVAYYTYETYHIRKATLSSNHLSFRPILVFNAADSFCTVTNKGNGPAFNTCLIIWDGNKFKISSDSTVPGVMPPSEMYLFDNHVEIDSADIKKRLPEFSTLTDRISAESHALFCLVYRDLVGNKFYSIINGSGAKYDGVFEHDEIA